MRYELNTRLRKELKAPMGPIVSREDAFEEGCIIVGDDCLSQALENGKKPLLGIYDNLIKREPSAMETRQVIDAWEARKTTAENPAGGITKEAVEAVKDALQSGKETKLEVKGEEDLLVLPCLVYAGLGSHIYYGQPGEGIALVEASEENKRKAEKILEEMRQ